MTSYIPKEEWASFGVFVIWVGVALFSQDMDRDNKS